MQNDCTYGSPLKHTNIKIRTGIPKSKQVLSLTATRSILAGIWCAESSRLVENLLETRCELVAASLNRTDLPYGRVGQRDLCDLRDAVLCRITLTTCFYSDRH